MDEVDEELPHESYEVFDVKPKTPALSVEDKPTLTERNRVVLNEILTEKNRDAL